MALPNAGVIGPGDPLQQVGLRYTAAGSDEFNDMQMYAWSYTVERFPQLREAMPGIEAFMALCPTLQRPKSAGRITLKSRDPHVQPNIEINLLAEEADMERMVDGVRRAWALLTASPIASLTAVVVRPDAATMEDDEKIRDYLRANVTHLVHPVGTCKMGPADDPLAVVDQYGRVHGMAGLRVADASIMPNLLRANTNLTAIMIGERVAKFIRADVG